MTETQEYLKCCDHYYAIDGSGAIAGLLGCCDGHWQWCKFDELEKRKKWVQKVKAETRRRLENFRDKWLAAGCWPTGDDTSAFSPSQAARLLNPYKGSGACAFIGDILHYPRFLDDFTFITVGGGGRLIGKLEPPRVKGVSPKDDREFARRGYSFDLAVEKFTDYIDWLGHRCSCASAASSATGKLVALTDWFRNCMDVSDSTLHDLQRRLSELKSALLDLSVRIGDSCEPSATARSVTVATDPRLLEGIDALRSGVGRINDDIDERRAKNRQQGAINRNGNKDNADHPSPKERTQAANDLETALKRIHERVMSKGGKVLEACRHVCLHFTPIPGRKDELGRMQYKPLVNQYGKEVKTETQFKTIARYYRARYNAKQRKK